MFIFQLAAMIFLRMGLFVVQVGDAGEGLALEEFEEAPPPVEAWVTLSTTLNFLAAVAVSPPPTTRDGSGGRGRGDGLRHGSWCLRQRDRTQTRRQGRSR